MNRKDTAMKIQILGTGCPKCKALMANAAKAVQELGITAELEKVEKIADIARMGVMMTPALAVDGQVKAAGQLLPVSRIKELLQSEIAGSQA
jgi:small redox-active disulfide protein 2